MDAAVLGEPAANSPLGRVERTSLHPIPHAGRINAGAERCGTAAKQCRALKRRSQLLFDDLVTCHNPPAFGLPLRAVVEGVQCGL
jgi:hypothetical protein